MSFFEMLSLHAGVYCAEQAYHSLSKKMRETDFLSYNPRYLGDCYKEEGDPIGKNLPYVEIEGFLRSSLSWNEFLTATNSLRIVKEKKPFSLAKSPPLELSDFQAQALAKFTGEGKIDRDDQVVRLKEYDSTQKTLHVQKCFYSDGLRSNYAMDLKGYLRLGDSSVSLRGILAAAYGKTLPPLSDNRLSNAIGIAVVVFYKTATGEILPYLPRRAKPGIYSEVFGVTKKQAVFSGGYHCTASGETMWKNSARSFDDIFTSDICRELDEEVGLTRDDLIWIHPVALCREFLRGGKPQLFFAAYTKMPSNEIGHRRRAAIERQKAQGRQEIEDDVLIASTPEDIFAELWRNGTMEAVVNMTFAQDCAYLAHRENKFR